MLAHISASKSLLGSMASRPNFAKVSQNERMRLQAMMHTLHGAPTSHMAQVSAEISGAGFAESDLNTLLDVVADLATSTTPRTDVEPRRTGLQDWVALVNHLPQSVWEDMKDGSVETLVEFSARLGLRHPSEPTAQVMSLMILFQSEGFDRCMGMAVEHKITLIKTVKHALKQKNRLSPPPLQFIPVLPKTPDDLRSKYRDVYDAVFAAVAPAKSPLSEVALQRLRLTPKMRSPKRGSVMHLGSLSSDSSLPSQVVAFGQGLMQQMTTLQQQMSHMQYGNFVGGGALTRQFSLQRAARMLALQGPPVPEPSDVRGPSLGAPRSHVQGSSLGSLSDVAEVDAADTGCPEDTQVSLVARAADPLPVDRNKAGAKKTIAEATACIVAALASKKDVSAEPKAKGNSKATAKAKAAALPTLGCKAKRKGRGKAKAKACGSTIKKAPKIEITHEGSRSQYLCRVPGYPSKTFRYKSSGASQRATLQQAEEWCKETCKKLKIDCPPQFG